MRSLDEEFWAELRSRSPTPWRRRKPPVMMMTSQGNSESFDRKIHVQSPLKGKGSKIQHSETTTHILVNKWGVYIYIYISITIYKQNSYFHLNLRLLAALCTAMFGEVFRCTKWHWGLLPVQSSLGQNVRSNRNSGEKLGCNGGLW